MQLHDVILGKPSYLFRYHPKKLVVIVSVPRLYSKGECVTATMTVKTKIMTVIIIWSIIHAISRGPRLQYILCPIPLLSLYPFDLQTDEQSLPLLYYFRCHAVDQSPVVGGVVMEHRGKCITSIMQNNKPALIFCAGIQIIANQRYR